MTRQFASLKNMILTASVALLPLGAVNASAQNSARVNVPFAFVANHYAVPAGSYKVLLSDATLTLINANTGKAQSMLLVRREDIGAIQTQGRLSFEISGGRYILTEVQFAGSSAHSKLLVQPKSEHEVAKNTEPGDATVELAMK
jgi:hypothetical protein